MINTDRPSYARTASLWIAAAVVASMAACSAGGEGPAKGKAGRTGPITVGYVVVQPTQAPIVSDLSGRTVAYQSSEVRPQVGGVIQKRLFTEGALVRAGQPLYQIDSSLYAASVKQAQANVESAEASQAAAQTLADRYKPLADIEAVSKQDYTNAVASARQASASVAQNRAALDTARINLRFTTVPAPITGRIGRSLFTVGALVTPSQTDPLATIQQLDPMFVDIQQSSADLLKLRRTLASGGAAATSAKVRLTLEDGSAYDQVGVVEFSEVVVDPTTGTVALRVRAPNPQGLLMPGMFVHASFAQAIENGVFLVPQVALARDPKGNATVYIVGPDHKAVQRIVTAERTQGVFWVVSKGLAAGDKVITQGLADLKPHAAIKAVPASTPQPIAPPKNRGPGAHKAKAGSAGAAGG